MRYLLFALVVMGCAGGQRLPREGLSDPSQLLFNGYTKADVVCYDCHGGDGLGTAMGPNLAEEVPEMTDEELAQALDDGPGLMPAYREKLSPEERQALLGWLRKTFGKS